MKLLILAYCFLALTLPCFFTAVILYHSVVHQKCPPQKDYIRACLKSNVRFDWEIVNFLLLIMMVISVCMFSFLLGIEHQNIFRLIYISI